jgi:hypothetical protein
MLGGVEWRHGAGDPTRAVVIINAATSVRCTYYSRIAEYLFSHGLDGALGFLVPDRCAGFKPHGRIGARSTLKPCSSAHSATTPANLSMWSVIALAAVQRAWGRPGR